MNTKVTGSEGERIASDFCRRQGFRILAKNWRFGRGEIDIIAQDGTCTVFIEVKYRTSRTFGYPEEAITPHKQHMLAQTIRGYLSQHPTSRFRVDVISIHKDRNKTHLLRFRDVDLTT